MKKKKKAVRKKGRVLKVVNKLPTSCSSCKAPCCQFGPGPYIHLDKNDFLENYNMPEAYNTRCVEFTKDGKCKLWGTPELPIECRTHICHNRSFTVEEIRTIEAVTNRTCKNCRTSWMLCFDDGDWSEHSMTCENCGWTGTWNWKESE